MTFKELCLLEDRLLKRLGANQLLAEFVKRLEWSQIEEIYVDINVETQKEETKKGAKKNV